MLAQQQGHSRMENGVFEIWLSFVEAYRKLLLSPSSEMRFVLETVGNHAPTAGRFFGEISLDRRLDRKMAVAWSPTSVWV